MSIQLLPIKDDPALLRLCNEGHEKNRSSVYLDGVVSNHGFAYFARA